MSDKSEKMPSITGVYFPAQWREVDLGLEILGEVYGDVIAQKSHPDYSPYSYIEDDGEPLVLSQECIDDWHWE
mgnify:CR=1 FL=1